MGRILASLLSALLLTAAGFAVRIYVRYIPGFADDVCDKLNPVWVNGIGRFCGLVPFSVVEILIYLILIWILVTAGRVMLALCKPNSGAVNEKHNKVKRIGGGFLLKALPLAALIFLLYETGEDMYFYRTSFAEAYGYGNGSYTTEQLVEVCKYLARECNEYAGLVERDERGIMKVSPDLPERLTQAMENLGTHFPMLEGHYNRPKGILISEIMSRTDMAGIYSAYTSEANYNRDMPEYNLPFTLSHELSHTHGVMRENEANFTAFLNCILSEEPDIYYSGVISGWVYCGNELYKRDYDKWLEIHNMLDERVVDDLADNTAFWAPYKKSKTAKSAQSFNDYYLKSHGTSGTDSYNEVVDLIVSCFRFRDEDTK